MWSCINDFFNFAEKEVNVDKFSTEMIELLNDLKTYSILILPALTSSSFKHK